MGFIREFTLLGPDQRKDLMGVFGIFGITVCCVVTAVCNLKKHKIDAIKEMSITYDDCGEAVHVKF